MKFKKITTFLIVLIFALSVFLPSNYTVKADTSAQISYSFSSSNIQVGQAFDITVNSSNVSDLYGASIDFNYDPTSIQITGIEQGNIFKNSGKTVNANTYVNDTTNGKISFGEMLQGNVSGLAVTTTNSLFVIHAKALKSGTTALNTISDNVNNSMSPTGNNVCVKLADSNGATISYTANATNVNVVTTPADDAQIVSDTIPTSMVAGQSYNVSVTVKNTGSETWTELSKFRLGPPGDKDAFYNTLVDGYPRVILASGVSVATGQTATFNFTMKAPAVGTYSTSWRMVKEHVAWFGNSLSKQITVTASADDAQIVSDTIPTSMVAGQSYNVSVTIKNTGSETWTELSKFRLGPVGDKDAFFNTLVDGYPRVTLASGVSVATGQTATFNFTMKAPAVGTYSTSWRMVKEHVAWFGNSLSKQITVTASADDAQIVSDTIPTSMVAGQSYNVSVTVKNTGSETWTELSKFRLGPVGDKDAFFNTLVDGYPRVTLASGVSVATGQTATFNFTMKAPAVGTYSTSWRMVKEHVAWFGNSLSKQITVTASADDAQIVSDTIPTSMVAGQSYNVSVTVKNTGSETWTELSKFRLGPVGDKDAFYNTLVDGYPRVTLASGVSVATGQTATFNFTMKAPAAGSYSTNWRMVKEHVAWFGNSLSKQITVTASADDAQIVSDTIPTSMVAGQSYNVSVTVKNTGSETWTELSKFRLGPVGDKDAFYNTLVDSYPRVTLASGVSVATGQTATFNFTMKAPAVGSYSTSWRMVKEHVAWFGNSLSKQITVTAPAADDAQIVSDTIPTSMVAGQSYNVSVTVKNTGSETWTELSKFRLGPVGDKDAFYNTLVDSYPRVTLASGVSVATGQTATFNFTMKAPAAGSYSTSWRMVKEHVAWFGNSLSKQITVTAPADDAQIVSDTIPTSMVAGQSYNVSVTVKNTGSETWTELSKFRLGPVGDKDAFYNTLVDSYPRVTLASGVSVATGQTATFNFTMKAPAAGSYSTSWRMVKEHVAWFGNSLSKQITVN